MPRCSTALRWAGGRADVYRDVGGRLLALRLSSTDELRSDLTDPQVADIVCCLNAAEYGVLPGRERSWTLE